MTIATHQPAATAITAPAASRCPIRRRTVAGAATRYTRAKAGTTRNACSILAKKPSPTQPPATSSHRRPPGSRERTIAYAPSVSSSTSSASGLLNRNISAATGVVAGTSPASSPQAAATCGPASAASDRRTAACSTPTAATPISACGTRMLQEFTPNTRADSAIGHSAPGVLSTVIAPAASEAPKKNAFQLTEPACAAAE